MKKIVIILSLIGFNFCFGGYSADDIFDAICNNNKKYFEKAKTNKVFNPNLLLDTTVGYSPLIYAIIWDKEEIFDSLLQCKDIDINQKTCNGHMFPLMFACLYKIKYPNENRDKYVEKLLKHPAIDINAINSEKVSTLFCIIAKKECHNLLPLFLNHPKINLSMKCHNETVEQLAKRLAKSNIIQQITQKKNKNNLDLNDDEKNNIIIENKIILEN